MPEILRLFGMKFFFFSREHEPIHVHVKNGDGNAKFEITDDSVKLVYNHGLKNKDIRAAEMVLEENHDLAIAKWIEYFGHSIEGGENDD